jgi:kynureninase
MSSAAEQAGSWPTGFRPEEAFAREADAADPLRRYRDQFFLPQGADSQPLIYFCGHSLGLQPRAVRGLIEEELDAWAQLGVDAHFKERLPWYSYHKEFRDRGARLVGARPDEVVMMNSLSVNLHLMMTTFYRPVGRRCKILMLEPSFPSDRYAVQSQIRHHGLDPAEALVAVNPRTGEHFLRTEDIEGILRQQGP